MTVRKDESGYVIPDLTLLGDEHVRRYRETDGAVGHIWNGATTLLLTTNGRKTGTPRTLPLIYGRDGENHLVVASKGGAPTHPAWYLNLLAYPEAEIQVQDKILQVHADTAKSPERERLWAIMTAVWPNYDQYAQRTDRKIPVVILRPAVEAT